MRKKRILFYFIIGIIACIPAISCLGKEIATRGKNYADSVIGSRIAFVSRGNDTIAKSTVTNVSDYYGIQNVGVSVREYHYEKGYTKISSDRKNVYNGEQIYAEISRSKSSRVVDYIHTGTAYNNPFEKHSYESYTLYAAQYYR